MSYSHFTHYTTKLQGHLHKSNELGKPYIKIKLSFHNINIKVKNIRTIFTTIIVKKY